MPYIRAIGTASPAYRVSQAQTIGFFDRFFAHDPLGRRKMRMLCQTSQIDFRYSVLPDFEADSTSFFYQPDQPPTTAQRMKMFEANALPLATQAVRNCVSQLPDYESVLPAVTHLITVSCTGMYAAGLDIELVETLHLSPSVQRTCINFMGCYAAFNALKLAHAFCQADPQATVLIVGIELCSLHLQPSATDDFLLANSLFADGAAAVLVTPEAKGKALQILQFHCDLASKGKTDMAWYVRDYGFEMRLSSYIPDLLKGSLEELVQKLLTKININAENIDFWAIHSGGRKILEAVEQSLGISPEQNSSAYHILRNYGNMSSVTVLFILHYILQNLQPTDQHKKLLSMAFGPGLTLESAVMQAQFE